MRVLVAMLHLLQPAARLWGRVRHGLGPWRRGGLSDWAFPRVRRVALWSETGRPHAVWLEDLEAALRSSSVLVRRGGEFDRFDLAVVGGPFGTARTLMAVEEHGQGHQLVRFRVWPKLRRGLFVTGLAGALAVGAFSDGAWLAGAALAAAALGLASSALRECGCAQGEILRALVDVAAAQGATQPRPSTARDVEPLGFEPRERLAAPHA